MSAPIFNNLFNSKSLKASGVATQLTQLFFGYIMRFQIGNDSLHVQRAGLVTMVKSAFVNSKQELKAERLLHDLDFSSHIKKNC